MGRGKGKGKAKGLSVSHGAGKGKGVDLGAKGMQGMKGMQDAKTSHPEYKSAVASFLIDLVAWKKISLPRMQEICSTVMLDLAYVVSQLSDTSDPGELATKMLPEIKRLSQLGSSGEHIHNIHKDFKRFMG